MRGRADDAYRNGGFRIGDRDIDFYGCRIWFGADAEADEVFMLT